MVEVSCNDTVDGQCSIVSAMPQEVSILNGACMKQGNTPGTTCPTGNLLGCCVGTATMTHYEVCYYKMTPAATPSECAMGGGMWSATLVPAP
jgi:hypothetical protein